MFLSLYVKPGFDWALHHPEESSVAWRSVLPLRVRQPTA